MSKQILDHYLQFGLFTNSGLYREKLIADLPDNVRKIGLLVRNQCIHRTTLADGNNGSNSDLKYGDMTRVPWYRQCEDDCLPTAAAMLAELYRRDGRGFITDRAEADRLIVTCRFVSILTVSILKSKNIPARVRSGFAPYFQGAGGKSVDHWINQYWDKDRNRWVTIDVDGCIEGFFDFDPFDIPEGPFDFSADAWLNVRAGKVRGEHFWNAGGFDGLMVVAWALFEDFHSLMNSEIIYQHEPEMVRPSNFNLLTESQLDEIDDLARLMQNPDGNFEQLKEIWETKREFRLLKGGLL